MAFESIRRDPLLGAMRALLTGFMWLLVVIGVIVIALIPVVLLNGDSVTMEIAGRTVESDPTLLALVCVTMAVVVVMCAMGWRFTGLLRAIVDTVSTGDPFVPENARRLTAMAWLSIALMVVAIVGGWLTVMLEARTEELQANFDVSVGGLLLPFVLFILARVFRTGTDMRAELEGTV